MCVPWELNPQPFALLRQSSTTEPQEHRLNKGQTELKLKRLPECTCWRREGTHQVGDVIWNVDGQRRDLGLDRFHRRLRRVPAVFLVTGQGSECNFDICAWKS